MLTCTCIGTCVCSLTYFMKFAVSIASCIMQYMARTTHHVYLWIFTDALEFMLLFFPMFTDVLSNEGPTHGICLDSTEPVLILVHHPQD